MYEKQLTVINLKDGRKLLFVSVVPGTPSDECEIILETFKNNIGEVNGSVILVFGKLETVFESEKPKGWLKRLIGWY